MPAPPAPSAISKPYTPYVTAAGVPTGLIGGISNNAVDPHLHDPYNITVNAGFQQEMPGRFVLRMNYDLRLGRRLLGQADASQLVEFVDPVSNQAMSAAFAGLATQLRGGVNTAQVAAQPWFEDVVTPGFYKGRNCGTVNGVTTACPNNTAVVAYNFKTNAQLGDMADVIRSLSSNGLIAANIGEASQFAENDYYTNKGFSTYNGLLLTLSKNLSQGVKFDFNYTWQHSIDNVSVIANTVASGTGFICDALRPRACRGNSDYDATHVVSSDFITQLPVGHGREFGNHLPIYLDELIGGWSISGTPRWQSGTAFTTATSAFLAGFANNDPAIFNGDRAAIKAHVHKNAAGQVVLFDDALAARAAAAFTGPLGFQYGSRNVLRGPSQFGMDAGLAKDFKILPKERLNAQFRADFFNVLNHPTFTTLTNNITSSTFGTLTTQANANGNGTRVGQFSLRLLF